MKIAILGDPHFRAEMPYASSIDDGRKGEWESVKKTILDTSKKCDAIVLMGDNLNSRNNPSIVLREFVEFLNGFDEKPVHILIGNHERHGENTALDFLDKVQHPNWHIYSDITESVEIGNGIYATFVPYMTPALLGLGTKEEAEGHINGLAKADIAFFHHAITGTAGTEFFDEIMIDQSKLKFGFTFGGHVHKSERLADNVVVTGNLMTHEVGEHKKVAWVWDSEKNTAEEIELPVRGIYKFIWEEQGIVAPSTSIVKCYVTDKNTDLEEVKEFLKQFDASLIIEQYPSERQKVHVQEGALDTSIESMLKLYAEAKSVDYNDLLAGLEIIK
jgi:DNA repair exonuclease SbcCD nuclease subunit